jgi:hypothetical protein
MALEELQVHPGPGPVCAPGRVEDLVPDGEGERQARLGGLVRSLGGVGRKGGVGVPAVTDSWPATSSRPQASSKSSHDRPSPALTKVRAT